MITLPYDFPYFVKFIDSKYLPSFLNKGEIFFGSNKKYRNIETKSGNRGIGDKDEGELRLYNPTIKIKDKNGKVHSAPKDTFNKVFVSEVCGDYCCARIDLYKDLISKEKRLKLKSDMNKMLLSDNRFSKKIILFDNFDYFLTSILTRLKKLGISFVTYGNVIYSKNKGNVVEALNDKCSNEYFNASYWANFVKDPYFKPEREYRIVMDFNSICTRINPNCLDTGLPIDIGNLRNHVKVFDNIDDLIRFISSKKYISNMYKFWNVHKSYKTGVFNKGIKICQLN